MIIGRDYLIVVRCLAASRSEKDSEHRVRVLCCAGLCRRKLNARAVRGNDVRYIIKFILVVIHSV